MRARWKRPYNRILQSRMTHLVGDEKKRTRDKYRGLRNETPPFPIASEEDAGLSQVARFLGRPEGAANFVSFTY